MCLIKNNVLRYFPFSMLPHLTDLDIFQQEDSLSVAPMPAPLPAPRVLLGFPPLATAGSSTVPKIEVGGQTPSPGSQTTLRTEAGGQAV
jgi:hypothetical protein